MPANSRVEKLKDKIIELIESEFGPDFGRSEARDLGLYTGLEHTSSKHQFWDRLNTEPGQKKHLARYLTRDNHGHARAPSLTWPGRIPGVKPHSRIFFESGSTICPLLGQFARQLTNPDNDKPAIAPPRSVLTNNLFALTALVNLVDRVIPVQGQFVSKYFGFFPFGDGKNAPSLDDKGVQNLQAWCDEAIAYTRLRKSISESDLVVTTASNFSFLAGPLVGSRANAITKHAIYLGKTTQIFVILVHFQKIIPITKPFIRMDQPSENCYCILDTPRNVKTKISADGWHDSWATGNMNIVATDFRKGVQSAVDKNQLRSGVFSESEFAKSWSEFGDRVHVVVSLPDKTNHKKAYRWLVSEVKACEENVRKFQGSVEFNLSEEQEAMSHGVVDVRISFRD